MYCPSRDTKAGCLVLSKLVMATETLNHDFYHTKYQMLPSKLNTGSNMSTLLKELWFSVNHGNHVLWFATNEFLLSQAHEIRGKCWLSSVQPMMRTALLSPTLMFTPAHMVASPVRGQFGPSLILPTSHSA